MYSIGVVGFIRASAYVHTQTNIVMHTHTHTTHTPLYSSCEPCVCVHIQQCTAVGDVAFGTNVSSTWL